MNSVFVYYSDDYADNGGIGLQEFIASPLTTKTPLEQAAEFIESRMLVKGTEANIANYTVIEGRGLPLKAVAVATKVAIGSS